MLLGFGEDGEVSNVPVYLACHLEMKLLCVIRLLSTGPLFTSFSLVGKQTLGWGKVGASPSPLFADTSKDSDLTLG